MLFHYFTPYTYNNLSLIAWLVLYVSIDNPNSGSEHRSLPDWFGRLPTLKRPRCRWWSRLWGCYSDVPGFKTLCLTKTKKEMALHYKGVSALSYHTALWHINHKIKPEGETEPSHAVRPRSPSVLREDRGPPASVLTCRWWHCRAYGFHAGREGRQDGRSWTFSEQILCKYCTKTPSVRHTFHTLNWPPSKKQTFIVPKFIPPPPPARLHSY